MEEEKPDQKEDQGQKWTYKVEDGDNSLIRGDKDYHYEYYAMDKGAWVDEPWVLDLFEGLRDRGLDYTVIPEEKVPAVLAKLDVRWKKFVDSQGNSAPGGSQGTPQEPPSQGPAPPAEKEAQI